MVDIVNSDNHIKLTFKDAMVIYRAEELYRQLAGQDWQCQQVAMDLSAVSEIDSTGVQLLMMIAKSTKEFGAEVELIHSQASSELFSLMHLQHHFGTAQQVGSASAKSE